MKYATWVCIGAAVFLTACASTPQTRIAANPALFASFPTNVQAGVRSGRIEVGYTKEMVRMAIGNPNHVFTRQTAAGIAEVWAYTDIRRTYETVPATGYTWWRGPYNGHPHPMSDFGWVDVERTQEYVVLLVEFAGDAVKVIDRKR